ncbi:MAG: isoprenylcysteine carboxylmethyltransferase family protein [Ilumatobacter sp.]
MSSTTSESTIGWMFVGAQAVLLVGLVVIPWPRHLANPGWLDGAASVCFWVGLVLGVAAGLVLGRSLTATPVPLERAALKTTGPYRFVRHPIYTGVVLIVAGLAIGRESWLALAWGAATIGFFHAKAAWEERRLTERYPDYSAYAARTPRFVPGLRSITSRR